MFKKIVAAHPRAPRRVGTQAQFHLILHDIIEKLNLEAAYEHFFVEFLDLKEPSTDGLESASLSAVAKLFVTDKTAFAKYFSNSEAVPRSIKMCALYLNVNDLESIIRGFNWTIMGEKEFRNSIVIPILEKKIELKNISLDDFDRISKVKMGNREDFFDKSCNTALGKMRKDLERSTAVVDRAKQKLNEIKLVNEFAMVIKRVRDNLTDYEQGAEQGAYSDTQLLWFAAQNVAAALKKLAVSAGASHADKKRIAEKCDILVNEFEFIQEHLREKDAFIEPYEDELKTALDNLLKSAEEIFKNESTPNIASILGKMEYALDFLANILKRIRFNEFVKSTPLLDLTAQIEAVRDGFQKLGFFGAGGDDEEIMRAKLGHDVLMKLMALGILQPKEAEKAAVTELILAEINAQLEPFGVKMAPNSHLLDFSKIIDLLIQSRRDLPDKLKPPSSKKAPQPSEWNPQNTIKVVPIQGKKVRLPHFLPVTLQVVEGDDYTPGMREPTQVFRMEENAIQSDPNLQGSQFYDPTHPATANTPPAATDNVPDFMRDRTNPFSPAFQPPAPEGEVRTNKGAVRFSDKTEGDVKRSPAQSAVPGKGVLRQNVISIEYINEYEGILELNELQEIRQELKRLPLVKDYFDPEFRCALEFIEGLFEENVFRLLQTRIDAFRANLKYERTNADELQKELDALIEFAIKQKEYVIEYQRLDKEISSLELKLNRLLHIENLRALKVFRSAVLQEKMPDLFQRIDALDAKMDRNIPCSSLKQKTGLARRVMALDKDFDFVPVQDADVVYPKLEIISQNQRMAARLRAGRRLRR